VFDDILAANKDVLTVTGFAAAVLWVFFASVMFHLERDNPAMIAPDGSHYYSSIPAAMWPTLLNLSGEVPLCDYTPLGKVAALALHLTRFLLGIIERSYLSGRVRHHGRRGGRVLCDPDRDSRRWLRRVGWGELRELRRRRRRWARAGRPEHADRSGLATAAARAPCGKRLDETCRICNGSNDPYWLQRPPPLACGC